MRLSLTTLAAALIAVAAPAHAQNLVANPGFENGAANWQFSGGFTGASTDGADAHTGNGYAFFGAVNSTGRATQTITTTPGATYEFSFWLTNVGGTPNSFAVQFGSTTVLDLLNAPAFDYHEFTYDVVATAAQTTLSFTGQQNPHYFYLDDVRVTPATVTPEPSTWALLGTGLATVGAAAARRRRTATV